MTHSIRTQRYVVLWLAAACLACAPAGPEGEPIHIADESAIIIWDAAAQTQHFIRRASFRTKAKDFGFFVPTPSVPELAEAEDNAFNHLRRLTAPKIEYREIPPGAKFELPKGAAKSAPVKLVATAKVAGYDAAVLEATDAGALNDWLKQRGYASSPDLVEWFKPYIEQKWKITAFKISSEAAESGRANSSAVRMSFKTPSPYFPYREPANQRSDASAGNRSRLLRIFLLADARFAGTVGKDGAWPGETVWSGRITEDHAKLIERAKLPPSTAAAATWLTEFEDTSSPRPGTDDVFFKLAADQSAVARPVQIVYVENLPGSQESAPPQVQAYKKGALERILDFILPEDLGLLILGAAALILLAILSACLYALYRLLARLTRSLRGR